jgi:hypothetical protein
MVTQEKGQDIGRWILEKLDMTMWTGMVRLWTGISGEVL